MQSLHVELLLEDDGFAVGGEKVAQMVEDPEDVGRCFVELCQFFEIRNWELKFFQRFLF